MNQVQQTGRLIPIASFGKGSDGLLVFRVISGLKRGEQGVRESPGVEPVFWEQLSQVLPHCSRTIQASEDEQENATVVQGLLEDLVERGIEPEVQRLFAIDVSKALRKAIRIIFGSDQLVQRCPLLKERNVLEYLPIERLS